MVTVDEVQEYWNVFESKLIKIIDEIVPLTVFKHNKIAEKPDRIVKNKINKNKIIKMLSVFY